MVRRGVDTNVLLYAHVPAFPEHTKVHRFLLNQLNNPDVVLAITPNILHEFVHIITDNRRFSPPLSMLDALKIARIYLGHSNIECVDINEAALKNAFDLMERYKLGRKRIADTLFAATLMYHDIQELITCNPSDFRLFKDLDVIDPREPDD